MAKLSKGSDAKSPVLGPKNQDSGTTSKNEKCIYGLVVFQSTYI